jgi:two-component system, NtrC family, response regulator AtoC
MSAEHGRVLVIDDEEGVRSFVAESLERDGHDVVQAEDGRGGLAAARDEPFDVVITDLKMPNVDGMTVVRTLRSEQPDVEIVVLTAHGDVASAVEAMKLGVFDYLQKPLPSPTALRELVRGALARRVELGATSTRVSRNALTFGAPAMKPVVAALMKVAKSNATVLLQGESGTGKEVAARTLHDASPRAEKPFVAINCAVLTENLLESELFGHEKGAFTGAHAQRRGRIELADGGTFFLDEVGELRPSLQAKLLRVLEERRFERLGGSSAIDVDVRWVAATHRDLRAMVKEGTFREDLYHRLAVFPIRLPPLRERREDIVPLAEALVAELAASAGRRPPRLDDAMKQRLERESWPGNVRELRNVLERALILADGPVLGLEHIWIETSDTPSAIETGSLVDIERRTIERTLAEVGGNRRAAAAKLGIGLRTLYDKLKRYDLR